jgi:hypothetical protein
VGVERGVGAGMGEVEVDSLDKCQYYIQMEHVGYKNGSLSST